MKKQKIARNLLMTALLFGGVFIAGAANNIYAQSGGMIGSGTRSSDDNGGYYGSGYDNGGGTLGSGTRTGEDEETGSNRDGSPMVGSGSLMSEQDASTFTWRSVWRLFI